MAKKYLYKGKEYCFGELAKLAKCSKKALESRLKKGWNIEKAIDTPQLRDVKRRGFKLEYNGKMVSVPQLSKETGISTALIWKRIDEGKSTKEIVKKPYVNKKVYEIKKGLCTRHEINQMGKDSSLSYNTIGKRLFDGWSIEEALNTPVLPGVRREMRFRVMYKGKDYTMRELSQLPECVVGVNTITSRIKNRGWSVENAITTPALSAAERARMAVETARKNGSFGKKAGKYMYKGKLCTIKELIALPECKLSYNGLFMRLKKGWDVERAVTARQNEERDPLQDNIPSKARKYELSGKYYSLSELLKLPECKVSEPTLQLNLRNGMTVKDAIVFKRKRGRKKKAA